MREPATMRPMPPSEIAVRPLDLADADVAGVVLELQRRSYAVEARLIGSGRIPPLHESLEELQACGETFLGACVDGRLAAVVSWRFDGATIDVHRLAVHPDFFRRGIGVALLRAALRSEPEARRAIAQTGAANDPAKRLYVGEGFVEVGEREILPGLWITQFERPLP
jgi:ribosomal protein S18 acetylase RimI-like enzyme